MCKRRFRLYQSHLYCLLKVDRILMIQSLLNSMRIEMNLSNLAGSTGSVSDGAVDLKQMLLMGTLGGLSTNTGRTLTGTSTNCCARTVLCVVVAVNVAVDVVKRSEETDRG